MNSQLFDSAELTVAKLELIRVQWNLIAKDFLLTDKNAAKISQGLLVDSGTYLWTCNAGHNPNKKYVLYIGKCTNLAKRIYAYTQPFQPQSPNDRKLVFLQNALGNTPFDLYFKNCKREELSFKEIEAIKTFVPVLNQRLPYLDEMRKELEQKYQNHYRQALADLPMQLGLDPEDLPA